MLSKSCSFENKNVLVTGATGLIGSNLIKRLLSCGAQVTALGRTEEKLCNVFSDEINNPSLALRAFSVMNEFPDEFNNVDYIFHAASPISGAEIRTKPVDTINANITGIMNCLDYLKKQKENGVNGRLIVFSSATVYGNLYSSDTSVSESETVYSDPLDSDNSPYSESKRMIEVISRAYFRQYGVESVIARIGYAYGYTGSAPNTAFYEFIGKAVSGENIVLNSSGAPRRDNIYVSDIVDGLITIAVSGNYGEAYNISSNGDKGNFCAIDEIAEYIADSANKLNTSGNISVIFNNGRSGERKTGLCMDNAKLKALGWDISYSVENGIFETVKSYFDTRG